MNEAIIKLAQQPDGHIEVLVNGASGVSVEAVRQMLFDLFFQTYDISVQVQPKETQAVPEQAEPEAEAGTGEMVDL